MKLSWKTELPMLAVLAAMFVLAAVSWNTLPDRLPVHWGANGQADGWGGKGFALLGLPIITTVTYLIIAFIPLIDPGRANFPRFAGPWIVFRFAFLLFMAGVYVLTHLSFRGVQFNMTNVILPMVGLLLVVVGWMMGRIQPNWTVGIRTPWTLSSRLSWERSHRLGSRLFMGAGLLFVVAGIVGREWALYAAIAGTAVIALITITYSYLVWKHDPNRVPPV